jgi:hypothetical protein
MLKMGANVVKTTAKAINYVVFLSIFELILGLFFRFLMPFLKLFFGL